MMKQRKFSFDIPRLKIGPSKSDNRALQNQLAFPPDSPPLAPKSVRPPLPLDIEADLRAACTNVLQGNKPSHEHYSDNSNKPQLDYAAIRSAPRKELEPVPVPLSKLGSNEPPTAKSQRSSTQNQPSDAYRYKPNTATEDLFRHEIKKQQRRSRAVSRADQLMAGPNVQDVEVEVKTRPRAESHSRSQSHPHASSSKLVAPKTEQIERPRPATRTASTETSGSTPQTDSTDYPWSASTAMTSAAITPAKGSKRTSSQEARNLPKAEDMQGDWIRTELEKRKRAQEEENGEYAQPSALGVSDERADSKSPVSSSQVSTPVAKVPARKPVPTSKSRNVPAVDVSRADSVQAQSIASPDSQQTTFQAESLRPSRSIRSSSRSGRETTRNGENVRERALSRARSVKRGVQEYVRSASRAASRSRPPKSSENAANLSRHGRSQSRTRNAVNHAREYFRPGSSAGSRKPSIDFNNTLSRSISQESVPTVNSETSPRQSKQHKLKQWASMHHIKGRVSSDDPSRPGSSGSNGGRGRSSNREGASHTPSSLSKPAVDLNRELPPLPSLDSWKDAQPARGPIKMDIPRHHASKPSRHRKEPSFTAPPVVGEADEIVAARMGSPVLRRAPKSDDTDASRYAPTRSPPPVPMHAPPIPPTSKPQLGDYHLLSRHDPAPPPAACSTLPSSLANVRHTRRRSRTTEQDSFPPSLGEKLRQASASSPDGKPIVATGQAQIVNTSRSPTGLNNLRDDDNQSLGTKLGRALSTRRGHPHHQQQHQQQHPHGATSSNTPTTGHSRTNSDHNRGLRKLSMDEYGRRSPMLNRVDIPNSSLNWGPRSPALSQASGKRSATPGKKWWQLGNNGNTKDKSGWMDQVVKDGVHHGTLVDSTGAPVLRY